jgi:N-methylhydantoinase A
VGTYLTALQKSLGENGFTGRLFVMQSNGGVMSPEIAKQHGARSLLSGPAAGPVAGLWYAGLHEISRIITIDMGGTSFDVCLINDGIPEITTDMEMGGFRVALPMVAVHTIGAGGGSIAHVNSRGLLQVGPQSAGALPGPVCYGRGGHEPTVTDADLVLGILDPTYFWGGRLRLDKDAARDSIAEVVAHRLQIGIEEAAYGIYKVVNANMVDAIREVSVRRGYDPREFILVVAGGAGPVHAGALAKELEIPLVIIPRNAPVFCAMGQLLSDLRHDFVRSYVTPLEKANFDRVKNLCDSMKAEALAFFDFEKVSSRRMVFLYSVDLRYVGQFNEIEVSVQDNLWNKGTLREIAQGFRKRHAALNGYVLDSVPLEIVNLRLCARGITDKPVPGEFSMGSVSNSLAEKASRRIFTGKEFVDIPVYDGSRLGWTSLVRGPSIIEEESTTLFVPTDYHVWCDKFGNYLMCSASRKAEEILESLRSANGNSQNRSRPDYNY